MADANYLAPGIAFYFFSGNFGTNNGGNAIRGAGNYVKDYFAYNGSTYYRGSTPNGGNAGNILISVGGNTGRLPTFDIKGSICLSGTAGDSCGIKTIGNSMNLFTNDFRVYTEAGTLGLYTLPGATSTTIYKSATTGHDLRLQANMTDSVPYIYLDGAEGVYINSTSFGGKGLYVNGSISSQTISGQWYSPIVRKGGKPAAGASYEGQIWRTSGAGTGAGSGTYVWMCVINSAGAYEWIQLGLSS
jgi:hypothetical protein